MATELTWASDVNKRVADVTSTVNAAGWEAWYLLACLVGNSNTPFSGATGKWTLYGSSDGVTSGINDSANDRLGITGSNTFNPAKFVPAAAGTAHTWCTLRSPVNFGVSGAYTYFTLDMNSGTNGLWTYVFSKAPPASVVQTGSTSSGSNTVTTNVTTNFVNLLVGMSVSGSGVPSNEYITTANSGSTTLVMTTGSGVTTSGPNDLTFAGTTRSRYVASDEWSYSGGKTSNDSLLALRRVSVHLSTRGDFWIYAASDGNGSKPYAVLGCTLLGNTHESDGYPVVTVFRGDNVASDIYQGLWPGGTSYYCVSGNNQTQMIKSRNHSGNGLPVWIMPTLALSTGSSSSSMGPLVTNDSLTVNNVSDGSYNAIPACYVCATASGSTEVKGRLLDVQLASGLLNQGSLIPPTAPYEYVKIGGLFLPWVNSNPPTY